MIHLTPLIVLMLRWTCMNVVVSDLLHLWVMGELRVKCYLCRWLLHVPIIPRMGVTLRCWVSRRWHSKGVPSYEGNDQLYYNETLAGRFEGQQVLCLVKCTSPTLCCLTKPWLYSDMAGSRPASQQILTEEYHPHIIKSMVSIPSVRPGDCVFWSADTVHAVENECNNATDSSVFYIPVTPLCAINSKCLRRQRDNFDKGV